MKITDVPVTCRCGWRGTVEDCIPDVDGRGNLGCPQCERVINTFIPKPKPGPSETKDAQANRT